MVRIKLKTLNNQHELNVSIPEGDEYFVMYMLTRLGGYQHFKAEYLYEDTDELATKGEMIRWLSEHVFYHTFTPQTYNNLKAYLIPKLKNPRH